MKNDSREYIFEMPMKVRDYEVDSEGIVNNAVYLHYLEHTRHEFCEWAGLSFRQMHACGIDPVLAKVTVEYRTPLGLGQHFVSCLALDRRGPLFVFYQDLFTVDGAPVVRAVVEVACLENGRLTRGLPLVEAFSKYLPEK